MLNNCVYNYLQDHWESEVHHLWTLHCHVDCISVCLDLKCGQERGWVRSIMCNRFITQSKTWATRASEESIKAESLLKTNTMSLIWQLLLVKRRQWHQRGGFVMRPLVLQREKSLQSFHSFTQISHEAFSWRRIKKTDGSVWCNLKNKAILTALIAHCTALLRNILLLKLQSR